MFFSLTKIIIVHASLSFCCLVISPHFCTSVVSYSCLGTEVFMITIFACFQGSFSDQYGRARVLIISLFACTISYLALAFSDTILLLVISRVLSGEGGRRFSSRCSRCINIQCSGTLLYTSKCMHGMNQTEAEYSRHARGPKEQV